VDSFEELISTFCDYLGLFCMPVVLLFNAHLCLCVFEVLVLKNTLMYGFVFVSVLGKVLINADLF
jgi:hypothetical protein